MPFNYNQQFQSYQPQQQPQQLFFPQPQGNIYMIGNSAELSNIPANVNLSAAICLNEGIIHLKTLQNGAPTVMSYRLSPMNAADASNGNVSDTNIEQKISGILKGYNDRIEALEKQLKVINNTPKQGGNLDWSTI